MTPMRWTPEGCGERLMDIVQSIGRQTELLFDERTALANYSNTPATLGSLDAIADAIAQVQKEAAAIPGHPGQWLRGTVTALDCFARCLQGDQLSYAEKVRAIQQVDLTPIPQKNFDALCDRIDRTLGGMGYAGTPAEKVRAYLSDTVIPADQVVDTAHKMISAMRKATLSRVVTLPNDEGVTAVNGVRGVFWSGFSRYNGNNKGELTFNLDRPWSTPTFSNVLSHEAYPGHQTFYCLWDVLYLKGEWPIEAAFYLINSPNNSLFEGAPENGLSFLGWLDEEIDPSIDPQLRLTYRLGRDILDLQRILQTQSCYLYHIEGGSREDAIAHLTGSGFFGEVEATNTVRFFTHPVQCTYYPSYYYGRHIVGQALQQYGTARRDEFFRELYTVPHTNETFIEAVAKATGKPFNPFSSI